MQIYVENLPEHMSLQDLENLFAPYGEVRSARIVKSQRGHYTRGLGFVEMLRINAEIAISQLDGRRIDLMVLRVGEEKS